MKYDTDTIRDIQRRVGAPSDGIFGPTTMDAIIAWRQRHIGEMTYASFLEAWGSASMSPSLFSRESRVLGIDVSHHQGSVDFETVKASGVGFAIIKATEGRTYTDPRFAENYAGFAGIPRGVYHYAHLAHEKRTDPVGGAENLLRAVGETLPELPLVLDLETHRVEMLTSLDGVRASVDWIHSFVDTLVRHTQRQPMLYWSRRIFDGRRLGQETLQFRHLPTWWARYVSQDTWSQLPSHPPNQPAGWGWDFWQFTSSGAIPGIRGPVDLNLFFGSDLERWMLLGGR